jgi:hypothetical protein
MFHSFILPYIIVPLILFIATIFGIFIIYGLMIFIILMCISAYENAKDIYYGEDYDKYLRKKIK